MKKQIVLLTLLAALAAIPAGCGVTTTTGGSGTPSVPSATVASSIGSLAMSTMDPSFYASSLLGISSINGIKVSSYSVPSLESDGWFHYSLSSSMTEGGYVVSYSYDMSFMAWGKSVGLIDSVAKYSSLKTGDSLDKFWAVVTYNSSVISPDGSTISYIIKAGDSKSTPLKMENMNAVTSSILTGPVSYSGTYLGTTYKTSITYSSLQYNTSTGYPDGSVNWSVSEGTTTTYSGTITYNGTRTATITFSTGATYTVDLASGTTTPASL